jgi:predicted DsbA family dithiol-disulfide isomerase
MSGTMQIDIFSDTVCPWCYLGKRRFELALGQRPQYEPRVFWRPFELHPDLPTEGVDRAAFIAARFEGRDLFAETENTLKSLGETVGIAFRFEAIARVPNTRRSHLLIALSGRFGCQAAVKDRFMRAYFEEGRDIGDVDELVALAAEAGVPEYQARRALVLRAGQDGVIAAERHAQLQGVSGVPTFVFDRHYVVSGAQETENFVRIFDQVAAHSAARESGH